MVALVIAGRRSPAGQRGVASTELLIVIVPLLTLVLGVIQLGLIYGAHLLVAHAAGRAARAAVVVLPDDHEEADYAGIPLNTVGSGAAGLPTYTSAPDGGRLTAIRDAARLILAPISPPLESWFGGSVAAAIGGSTALSIAAGLAGWSRHAVAVTFPDGEGGYRASFGPREPIAVRVTYLFRCGVPVGRRLACRRWLALEERRRRELSTAGAELIGAAGELAGWSFAALAAERTLPNQGR